MITIAVSGHRQLADEQKVRDEVVCSLAYFKALYKDEKIVALSAVAEGADTIFAEEALNMNIPLRIMLPFALEEYEQGFSNRRRKKKLRAILKRNKNDYEIVCPDFNGAKDEREDAYLLTGKKLVDNADILFAIWDGKEADGKGGTAEIVAYAKQAKVKTYITKAPKPMWEKNTTEKLFDRLDRWAIIFKKVLFRFAWMVGVACGVFAAFCFATTLVFHHYFEGEIDVLHKIEFLEAGFLVASAILLVLGANYTKKKFLENRRNAEYLRSILWYWNAGIPVPGVMDQAVEGVADKVIKEAGKLRQENDRITDLTNAKRIVWVLAENQIRYHDRARIKRFTHSYEIVEKMILCIKILFFSIVGIKVCLEVFDEIKPALFEYLFLSRELLLELAKFSIIVLPACFAALEGALHYAEWKHHISISEKIVKDLAKSQEKIKDCATGEKLQGIASEIREILEQENEGWTKRISEITITVSV